LLTHIVHLLDKDNNILKNARYIDQYFICKTKLEPWIWISGFQIGSRAAVIVRN